MFNSQYAKIITSVGGFTLEFAPMLPDGVTDKDYLNLGWKKLVITNPPDVDITKYIITNDGYEETETQLISKWKVIEKPVLPMRISKYKLITKLMEAGLWQQVKQLIENSGLIDLFNAAQELSSDDQFFKQGVQLAKEQFGMDDEQVEAFLKDCIAD